MDAVEKYMKMTFLDDYMMKRMFSFSGKEKLFEKIVSIILDRKDIQITKVEHQRQMYGNSKTIILDAYGEDKEGRVYDIEIQKYNEPDIGLRARAYGDIIDMEMLKPGKHYNMLPTRYVIFICDGDPYRKYDGIDFLMREFSNVTRTGVPMEDNTNTIYINCGYKGEGRDDLLDLIHDMNCPDAGDLKIPEIKIIMETMRTREEIMAYTNIVSDSIEEGRQKGLEEGRIQGIKEGRIQGIKEGKEAGVKEGSIQEKRILAAKLLKEGMTAEKTAELTELSIEEVLKIADQKIS